jgi:LmbE family N-acetylglucosaminyl deacetylase
VHPDHNAIGEATVRAVSRLPEDERPEIYASAISKNCREVLGPPDVTIDVSSVWERKLAAIRAHRSQSDVVTTEWDRLIAENPDKADEILAPQKVEYFWKYNKW